MYRFVGCRLAVLFAVLLASIAGPLSSAFAYPGAHHTLACTDCHLIEPDPAVDTAETVTFLAPNAEELCLGCHDDQRYTEVHHSPVNYKHLSSGFVPMSMYAQYQAWINAHGNEYSPPLNESALKMTPTTQGPPGYRYSCNTCHPGMGGGYPRILMTNMELCIACHGGEGNADTPIDPRFSNSPRVLYNPTHLGINDGSVEFPPPTGAPRNGDQVSGQVPIPYAIAHSFHTNVNENLAFRVKIDHGAGGSTITQEVAELVPLRWYTNTSDLASPRCMPILQLDTAGWPSGSHLVKLIPYNPTLPPETQEGLPYSLNLTTATADKIPVILIPGVMATKLYTGTELVWIHELDFIWPGDTFLDPLALEVDGATDSDSSRPINLFSGNNPSPEAFSYWNQNIRADDYKGIFDRLVTEGYTPSSAANIENFSFFAYDWRKAPNDEADEASVVNKLRERIMLITDNGQRQVDLVAHSLGGLVLKAYLNKYGTQSLVRKAITVGTPHVGLAKAFRSVQFGWWGFSWLKDLVINENEIAKISQNWRVPYAGVPDDAYYSNAGYGSIFKERDADADMDNNGVYGEWDNEKVRGYLHGGYYFKWWWANPTPDTDRPHNSSLANQGETFHDNSDSLATWAGQAGAVHLIASRGLATLTQMELYNPQNQYFEHAWALTNHVESGDGTVPTRSASLENDGSFSENVSRYWVTNGQHGDLLKNNNTVSQLVADILAGRSTQLPGVETAAPVSDTVSAIELEANCPVDVHIYDLQGNHVGPVSDTKIEYGIGDVVYDRVSSFDGYSTTAYLPTDRPFTVWFRATNSGKFRLALRVIENNVITRTVIYDDVSLLPQTIASFNVPAPVSFGTLAVDLNGDGTADQQLTANADLSKDEREDHAAPITPITLQGNLGENGYYRSVVQVFLNAYDPPDGSGVQRTEYRIGDGSWLRYAGSFPLTQECGVVVGYRSLDFSYNREDDQGTAVQIDVTGPVVASFALSPNVLWPPSHKMVEVIPAVTTSDNCGGQVSWTVKSISMNEGDQVNTYDPLFDQDVEDGHTIGDMQVIGGKIYLRAERAGKSAGRTYTVTLSARDRAGNETLAQALVSVPHDQR